jgi:hypothetical protein
MKLKILNVILIVEIVLILAMVIAGLAVSCGLPPGAKVESQDISGIFLAL